MVTKETLSSMVEQLLQGTGHFLVDAEVRPNGTVVVEVDNDRAIRLNELAELNRALRSELDALGVDVELQVSSPGMGRPFKVARQYQKHLGRLVQVQLADGRSIEGILEEATNAGIALRIQHPSKTKGRPPRLDDAATTISLADIKTTRTIITFN